MTLITGTPYTVIVFAPRVQGNQGRTCHGSLCRGCDLTLEACALDFDVQ